MKNSTTEKKQQFLKLTFSVFIIIRSKGYFVTRKLLGHVYVLN
ncbi:hypothetical protein JN11_03282 [Mucilaginibacter frigoritolerans]|uniref:Uncharacterized protein n=1 Tax=Mucilaginibacter frigoritolerans TaxID=652788 RepID=A0A562TXH7_9SPHI|nr:hypothetical protein JN11_03282 [Mucilaginibacter frigoritolerans]